MGSATLARTPLGRRARRLRASGCTRELAPCGALLVSVLLLSLAGSIAATAALAQPVMIAPASYGEASRGGFVLTPIPSIYGTAELQQRWRQGRDLEIAEDFMAAARLHEALVAARPDSAYGYWKVSRNLWRHAERLPVDAKAERMAFFEQADAWAARGLAIDADCAPCMLWKFGAMGRIATTRGVMQSLSMGREMRGLLERGIALEPSYADTPTNSTLGNLYYASAVFHRVVPEWKWLEWIVGVRGDVDHSLVMIRSAVDLAPERIDYLVEHGAVLNCYAQRRDEEWATAEATKVLSHATRLEPRIGTDPLDQEHARTLMRDPSQSCGYSRDGWIDTARREVAQEH
jgi:hypothetical protein